MKKLLLILLGMTFLYGVDNVRVVPVAPSPEPNTVVTRIIFPRPHENKRKAPINVQLRVEGFPLGVITQNDRAKEIYNDPEGQAIHVVIDNEPYLIYNQSFEDSFDENREYYDKIVSFHIPFNLRPGQHVIRAFPARSYGESLKGRGPFTSEVFYFQDRKKSDTMNVDLKGPYLTYNEPQGRYPASQSNPILLDFLLSNCDLSSDGYKVRLTVDEQEIQLLTDYVPYYLYGLSPGKHTIKLELLDKNGALVPGFFNVTEREITIDNNIPRRR
ncbi:hypothetical protein [Candidatus Neptunochlamydia vexilliferae]|uniref:Uncharacterized protein n=1 Tax=Candidatus Neptunichlamydia vexilliferae TaxID=1651774 RepID=A0ABS0B193_9BACT|nr:hypothetical protein [Candidatus Neptunochlamydia vexilliferae]MBF5060163.1 hypothetical protein [Candidatus Neptunochlamydia vexilliferae]